MKIIVLSDIHGKSNALYDAIDNCKDAKLVIIAGDLAPMRSFSIYGYYDQLDWTQHIFGMITNTYKDKIFVVVPGNHDLYLDKEKAPKAVFEEAKITFSKMSNVKLLIDEAVEVEGLKIYGTPYVCPINGVWAFEKIDQAQELLFKKIPENLDILVAHAPPRWKKVDISLQNDVSVQEPYGSKPLLNAILEKKPKYVFCGHIHSGSHTLTKVGSSKLRNVSILDEEYNVHYKPYIISL